MTKSVTCPEELGGLASQVTVDYAQLAHQGRLAAATAEPEEVRIYKLVFFSEDAGKILCTHTKDSIYHPFRAVHILKCRTEISA